MNPNPIVLSIPIFFILIGVELLVERFTHQKLYRLQDAIANLSCGITKKVVYENEEFNLLQHALNIEDGLEGLRYNQVIIATDADVDGMHIRLLLMAFSKF